MAANVDASSPVSPYAGMAVGVVIVSTAAIAIRYAQEGAPSLSIAAWRLTLASVILAPIVLSGAPAGRAPHSAPWEFSAAAGASWARRIRTSSFILGAFCVDGSRCAESASRHGLK